MKAGRFAWAALLTACVVGEPVDLLDADGDGIEIAEDCDDEDAAVGARYEDADGDGYGAAPSRELCSAPDDARFATVGGDCNDDDTTIGPHEDERCGMEDEDCDGIVDEGLSCAPPEETPSAGPPPALDAEP